MFDRVLDTPQFTLLPVKPLIRFYPLNPIQDRGGRGEAKRPPTSYSPVTSTNVVISFQNFLTFSFNPFATLVSNFKAISSASPKLLNLNQDHPSKKCFFWSNRYIIEMLQLLNLGHMTTSTI